MSERGGNNEKKNNGISMKKRGERGGGGRGSVTIRGARVSEKTIAR